MKICFCRTRYSYPSYTDFWKLVELGKFEQRFIDEIDYSENKVFLYTPTNGETRDGENLPVHQANKGKKKRCKIIHWLLERPEPDEDNSGINDTINYMVGEGFIDEVFVSDRAYEKWIDNPNVRFVPLGSHPDLNPHQDVTTFTEYAVAHLMASYGRRQKVINDLNDRMWVTPEGEVVNLRVCPNGFGEENSLQLAQTLMMLNIHKDNLNFFEPLRFAKAAAYHQALITEKCSDPYPLTEDCYYECTLDNAVDTVQDILENKQLELEYKANALFQKLCVEYRFDKIIKRKIKDGIHITKV